MRQLVRFKWGMRGQGIRKKSCYIEPIEIAGSLTAKHCGDCTSDCSNGVLVYNQPCKVLKPYGSTGGIGGVKLKENEKDIASPITARDYKGILRNDGDAIVEIRTVLTPDREEKRQNGRRMKDDGEPMFTLTAQDRHGVAILRKERNEYGKSIRKDYEAGKVAESRHNMTQYACREDGISNTLSTVQKDNLLMCAYDEQNNTLCTDGTDKALKVIDVYNKRELKGGIVGTLTANGNTSIGHCGTFLVADYNDSNIQTDSNRPKVIGGVGEKTFGKQYHQGNRIYDVGHVSPTLQANNGNASKGSIIIGGQNIRIRRLTPKECWRLQGFPDEYFDKAKAAGISDSQLYKMAGNAVTVNVARAIGERLKEIEDEET